MSNFELRTNNSTTNPIAQAKEEKADKLKSEQKTRVNSLFEKLEEQRKVYAQTTKNYYKTKFQNYILKNRSERYETSGFLKDKATAKYQASQENLKTARHDRDAELSRLESYTDAFCHANSASIFSL